MTPSNNTATNHSATLELSHGAISASQPLSPLCALQEVSSALLRMGVPHLVEYVTPDGLFSVDIALRNGNQVHALPRNSQQQHGSRLADVPQPAPQQQPPSGRGWLGGGGASLCLSHACFSASGVCVSLWGPAAWSGAALRAGSYIRPSTSGSGSFSVNLGSNTTWVLCCAADCAGGGRSTSLHHQLAAAYGAHHHEVRFAAKARARDCTSVGLLSVLVRMLPANQVSRASIPCSPCSVQYARAGPYAKPLLT